MRKLRVLYCYRYGILGGVCTQLLNRLRYFDSSEGGLEIHLLFEHDCGISSSLAGRRHVYFSESLPRLVRRHRYEAVVVVDTENYLEQATRTRGHHRIVAEVHTSTGTGLQYLRSTRRWRADAFFVPSAYMKGVVEQRLGLHGSTRVEIMPNCIDADIIRPVTVQVPPRRPVLLWVGKIDAHKNWAAFVEIAATLRSRGADFECWVIGGETCEDEATVEMIESVSSAQLIDRWCWLDRIEYVDMPAVYSAAATSGGVLVSTSVDETFGMAVLESLLCGCPVVSSRVGAIEEIVVNRDYLSLFALDDIPGAADMVTVAFQSSARLRAELQRDGDHLRTRFDVAHVCHRYESCLRGICENPGLLTSSRRRATS